MPLPSSFALSYSLPPAPPDGHPVQLAERLKLSDPLWLEGRRGCRGDVDQEPPWLLRLRGLHRELEVSGVQPGRWSGPSRPSRCP